MGKGTDIEFLVEFGGSEVLGIVVCNCLGRYLLQVGQDFLSVSQLVVAH